jgi:uncharacterized protein YxeA
MIGTIILIVVIAVTVALGRYAIAEGQRIERQNKFIRNLNNHDKKKKTK